MNSYKKVPTIKEIAKQLNVSASTVSRALHNHPSIGLRTKTQVQALAKELNYERNETAISFQKGKTFTVGVVLPKFSEEFFSLAISGIEDFAINNKYNVLIGQSYDDMEREIQIANTMKNSRVDGLIVSLAKTSRNIQHFENLEKYNIPVVFFDCIPDKPGCNSVSCNLQHGTMEGVHYLAKTGHKRIALINGPRSLQASQQRENAYIDGLKANKLKPDITLMVSTDLSRQGTQEAIQQLLDIKNPPTAIIAFNDYVALEAMQYARSKKIRINKDISFVSFAHLPLCSYMDNPPLASVEQFPYEQGYKAMEMLFSIIQNDGAHEKPGQIILESQLVPWSESGS